jgi:hypothetical protein
MKEVSASYAAVAFERIAAFYDTFIVRNPIAYHTGQKSGENKNLLYGTCRCR